MCKFGDEEADALSEPLEFFSNSAEFSKPKRLGYVQLMCKWRFQRSSRTPLLANCFPEAPRHLLLFEHLFSS